MKCKNRPAMRLDTLGIERVIVRENCRGVAACVEFVDRGAAHGHFLPFLDDRFNLAQGETAEASHQNIREA